MCKSLKKNLSKQSASLCFSAMFKGSFPPLDLHLSDRLGGGAEASTAFTFERL
jgi:hypothetical protein